MYTVIENKVYNTETSIKIAERDNGLFVNDFNYCCQALYKTPEGEYFELGEGGARTQFMTSYHDEEMSGRRITPMSANDAKQWLSDANATQEELDKF